MHRTQALAGVFFGKGAAGVVVGPDGGISDGFADAAPGDRDGLPPPTVPLIAAMFLPGLSRRTKTRPGDRASKWQVAIWKRRVGLRVCVGWNVEVSPLGEPDDGLVQAATVENSLVPWYPLGCGGKTVVCPACPERSRGVDVAA